MRTAFIHASIVAFIFAAPFAAGCAEASSGNNQPASPEPLVVENDGKTVVEIRELNRMIDELFADVVTDDGLVRYERLRGTHRKTLRKLADAFGASREFESDRQKLAFLINAYNVHVLNSVIENWPVENVTNVQGFFDKTKQAVAGKQLTLNELENDEIRAFNEPRIHAALVCAAMSCPPLLSEAFTAEKLDDQLSHVSKRWVNNPVKNRVEGNTIYASKIFEWYGKDFSAGPYGSVLGFLSHFANVDSRLGEVLASDQKPALEFSEYDWQLNQPVQ